ncbi:MAG: iron ABC transporter permease [Eubacteriales bacterium]
MKSKKNPVATGVFSCVVVAILIFMVALMAMVMGSIQVTLVDVFKGLFMEYDKRVATIYDLRFPRILVSLMAGGALSASGLLFQSALRNPLADPGIIGISGGAAFAAALVSALFPMLYFSIPLFACLGGVVAYLLIYFLAWKGVLDPVRIILVGIAVAAVFSGLTSIFNSISNRTGVSLTVSGLTQLVWSDVKLLAIYVSIGLVGALLLAPVCNIMALEDSTVRGLGIHVDVIRLIISGVAVILCAGVTAVVGVIGFLALVSPHMARRIVGNDHRILTPFTILLGALLLLVADTLGRTLFAPVEVSANILMNIIGGPFFIYLLRREASSGGG